MGVFCRHERFRFTRDLAAGPCANAAFQAGVRSASRAGREREYALFPVKDRTAGGAALRV